MKNMKNLLDFKKAPYTVVAALVLIIFTIGCSSSDTENSVPTAIKFNKLKTDALNSLTQHFEFNTSDGYGSFITSKGVILSIDPSTLTLNGNPVTGQIDIEYIEIFDGGNMAVTGKHTMGKMPDGNHSLLLSGGEFYINATKNGQQLELNGSIDLQISTNLTDGDNGGNPDMTLWKLTENDSVWVTDTIFNPAAANGVFLGGGLANLGYPSYSAFISSFGWTNVDCFYNDPREKTTILVSVPEGYNQTNSAVFLHYDGRGNALAQLDTYNTETMLFSEHYGQIPIGLNCHIIFVSESNGQWRYAIKQATVTAEALYNFALSETTVGTQTQLTSAINALP